MSTGGKRLNELLKKHGIRVGFVSDGIGVGRNTISTWGENAPIGKLVEISEVARIPLRDVLRCFIPDIDQLIPSDQIDDGRN
jgi:hypothetical protein